MAYHSDFGCMFASWWKFALALLMHVIENRVFELIGPLLYVVYTFGSLRKTIFQYFHHDLSKPNYILRCIKSVDHNSLLEA